MRRKRVESEMVEAERAEVRPERGLCSAGSCCQIEHRKNRLHKSTKLATKIRNGMQVYLSKIPAAFVVLCLSLCSASNAYAQELSAERLQDALVGYWRVLNTPKEIVLVINRDLTYQYYVDKTREDYGNLEIEFRVMFRLKFNSCDGITQLGDSGTYNKYIWMLPGERLQFGSSPVDGSDTFCERMTREEISDFWGGKQLTRIFRKKSETLLRAYFEAWRNMEPDISRENPRRKMGAVEEEAYAFFHDFNLEKTDTGQVPKYALVEIVLGKVETGQFNLPSKTELDSFVNQWTGKKDYRAEINDDKMYDRIVAENLMSHFYEKKLTSQPVQTYRLDNFMPAFGKQPNVTFLLLRPARRAVLDACMRAKDKNNRNGYFIRNYLHNRIGVPYDLAATPTIKRLVFNTTLDLAIVNHTEPYEDVQDLYQKINGKWQFHSNIIHISQ